MGLALTAAIRLWETRVPSDLQAHFRPIADRDGCCENPGMKRKLVTLLAASLSGACATDPGDRDAARSVVRDCGAEGMIAVRVVDHRAVEFRPRADATYDQVECVLTGLRRLGIDFPHEGLVSGPSPGE